MQKVKNDPETTIHTNVQGGHVEYATSGIVYCLFSLLKQLQKCSHLLSLKTHRGAHKHKVTCLDHFEF